MTTQSMVLNLKQILDDMPQDQKDSLQHLVDSSVLSQNFGELMRRYAGQWAGSYEGVVCVAPTLDELKVKFGENAEKIASTFLDDRKIGHAA